MTLIQRKILVHGPDNPITFEANSAFSSVIDFRNIAGACICFDGAVTSASIGLVISTKPDGDFKPLLDGTTPIQIETIVADKWRNIPDDAFPIHYAKLWSQNGSGVDEPQTSARTVELMGKT